MHLFGRIYQQNQVHHVDKESHGMFLNYDDLVYEWHLNSPNTIGDDDNDNDNNNNNNNYSPDIVGDV